MKRLFAFLLVTILAFQLVSCNTGSGGGETPGGEETPREEDVPLGKEVGYRAFTMDLQLLGGGGTVNPKDYKGKVVVLNFWGTWCGPCKNELPHFNELAEEYSDKVVFLLVHSVSEGKEEPYSYVSENFPNSPMVFARDELMGQYDKYYHLLGGDGYYPRTYVLDSDGVITYADSGALTKVQLQLLIEQALSKK